MSGFDQGTVFYSDALFNQNTDLDNVANLNLARKKFRDFIREFNEGGLNFKYRDQLKRNYVMNQHFLVINLYDLHNYNAGLTEELTNRPAEFVQAFEEAATEVANELIRNTPNEDAQLSSPCQIMLEWEANCISLRDIKSDNVSKLVKISGIVIAASAVRSKALKLTLQCRGCRQYLPNLTVKPGLDGYMLPRKCPSVQTGGTGAGKCPLDPFFIVPDKCKCVDFQMLKLQESPENVPHGEMPRHVQLYCDRFICEKAVPGNRVTIIGNDTKAVGVRQPYVRVLGMLVDNEGPGRSGMSCKVGSGYLTEHEEDEIKRLSQRSNIYEIIAKSIAPSIFGSLDIKKAIACLLFGGSRKRLPDGLCRRGDINLLMLGDPGTAKSQLLKFVERCAPVGVYTSGKGSSAAGLTASVIRDSVSRNFVMEGGAMVLADGGVVCIDEFDKMREDDRVAIHEAMEQQTISIAKAGITTTLNSRCSVLAAANSVYGRWDETKGESNIDFMPTILSRFDMIFVVRDEHDANRDATLARHVMQVHMCGNDLNPRSEEKTNSQPDEISLQTLRKFIAYARDSCGPRLSESASHRLINSYVSMRSRGSRIEKETGKRNSIPITVRQLEAVVRISESLAKMRLAPFANELDVEEALRLFQVSTMEAAQTGSLSGAEGFTTQEEHAIIITIEKQLKKRFVIGSQVSEQAIVNEFVKQNFPLSAIQKVLQCLLRRGEIQYRMQRRVLYRLK